MIPIFAILDATEILVPTIRSEIQPEEAKLTESIRDHGPDIPAFAREVFRLHGGTVMLCYHPQGGTEATWTIAL